MKKATLCILTILAILFSLIGCQRKNEDIEHAPVNTRVFSDSTGRQIELPATIDKVAVTGPLSQIIIFALSPDKLVGVSTNWDDSAHAYIDEKYLKLPVLGQLYGGRGTINLESLLAANPQVVIDIGEQRDGIADDMNRLTEKTGIPFVHIDADITSYSEVYATLGDLLGMQDKAKILSEYCHSTYRKAVELASEVDKKNIIYAVGSEGLHVIAQHSYHSEIIDLLSNNVAVVDNPSSRGTGNEVDIEQILNWNPDYIIYESDSFLDMIQKNPAWQSIFAVKEERYYQTPKTPYNWMGFPPSIQRYSGILWLAKLLYPETAHYDMQKEIQKYFQLFYHTDLTEDQFNTLMKNSLKRKN